MRVARYVEMSSRSRRRKAIAAQPDKATVKSAGLSIPMIALLFAIAVLLFYAVPLFDSAASIQWDAADYHYTAQKYFSDELRAGHLPFWTPYLFSGMPFLADPQVGAWYPLNWPFFLIGITPRAIEWETALHCFIAAFGAFLFARDLFRSRWAGVFCGAFYALSGFFAGHSSHTGIFQTAAVFPWLLWAGLRAVHSLRWLPAAAIVAGSMVLIGHFQTALYALCAFALLVAVDSVKERRPVRNVAFVLGTVAVGCEVLPAAMTLPGLEFTSQTERSTVSYSQSANAVLAPGALLTMLSPDHYHAPEGNYSGPQDITQFYLYQGILLLPLALVGLTVARVRWLALALIVSATWYAFGPSGGLYSLLSRLPGLRSVRSPIHDWFIVAWGLALLAAAGVSALRARFTSRWLPFALLAVVMGDLWYWNMDHNRLAYARASFESLYGSLEQRFAEVVAGSGAAGPLARVWAPADSPAFGPLNGALDSRIEVTYGYNPLFLRRYARYMQASRTNPRLLDSLAVTAKLDVPHGRFFPNPAALPRLSVPQSVATAAGAEDSARQIALLDPSRQGVVEGRPAIPANGPATIQLTHYQGDFYRAHYQASLATLVRLSVPYYPGWRAEIDGQPQPLLPVDLALMGVIVPAGDHDLVFRYHSDWFAAGALVSLIAWIAVIAWAVSSFRGRVTESQ